MFVCLFLATLSMICVNLKIIDEKPTQQGLRAPCQGEPLGIKRHEIPMPHEIGLVMGLTWKVSSVNQGGGDQ